MDLLDINFLSPSIILNSKNLYIIIFKRKLFALIKQLISEVKMFKLVIEAIDPIELVKIAGTFENTNLNIGIQPPREGLIPYEISEMVISIGGAAAWWTLLELFQILKNKKGKLNTLESDSDELIDFILKCGEKVNYKLKSVKKDENAAEYIFETNDERLLKISITRDFNISEEEV